MASSGMLLPPSHEFREESLEAKIRWFHSLSMEERLEAFIAWMELLLSLNPELLERKKRQPPPGGLRAQVVTPSPE